MDTRYLVRTLGGEQAWKTLSLSTEERRLLSLAKEPIAEASVQVVIGPNPLLKMMLARGWLKWQQGNEQVVAPPTSSSPALDRLQRRLAEQPSQPASDTSEPSVQPTGALPARPDTLASLSTPASPELSSVPSTPSVVRVEAPLVSLAQDFSPHAEDPNDPRMEQPKEVVGLEEKASNLPYFPTDDTTDDTADNSEDILSNISSADEENSLHHGGTLRVDEDAPSSIVAGEESINAAEFAHQSLFGVARTENGSANNTAPEDFDQQDFDQQAFDQESSVELSEEMQFEELRRAAMASQSFEDDVDFKEDEVSQYGGKDADPVDTSMEEPSLPLEDGVPSHQESYAQIDASYDRTAANFDANKTDISLAGAPLAVGDFSDASNSSKEDEHYSTHASQPLFPLPPPGEPSVPHAPTLMEKLNAPLPVPSAQEISESLERFFQVFGRPRSK